MILPMQSWIVLAVGALVASGCAILGAFLVLRKVAMLGDAISHAVLPGIALAFLLTGSRAPGIMVLGAAAFGVLTVFLVGVLHRTRRMHEDASIGVVFPALFSIGVILISRYAYAVDIDVDCVLYGEISYAPLDRLIAYGRDFGPKALWVCGVTLVIDVVFVALFYKELKITSFDPALAATLGLSPVLIHYLLMSAVSITVVGAFESVGAILVVAMLIVPPATAYLLTHRLSTMLVLSVALGVTASTTGYFAARWLDCSVAGAMAACAGGIFVLTLLGSPREGLLATLWRRRRLARDFHRNLVLLHLGEEGEGVPLESLRRRFGWSPRRIEATLAALERDVLIERSAGGLRLTGAGAQAIETAGIGDLAHR